MKSLLDADIAFFLYNLLPFCTEAEVNKLLGQSLRLAFGYEVEITGDGVASVKTVSLVAGNATDAYCFHRGVTYPREI